MKAIKISQNQGLRSCNIENFGLILIIILTVVCIKTGLWLTFAAEQTIAIMSEQVFVMPAIELANLGLKSPEKIHYQSSPEELVQDSLRIKEGVLNDTGALM